MANKATKLALTKVQDIQAELDSFIQEVITEYQSRHCVTVLRHNLDSRDLADAGRHHVASCIFRLNLIFESSSGISRPCVLIKVPHLSSLYESLQKTGMYEKEAYMYKTVLPRFYQIWSDESFSPTFYAASASGILALENLVESGFQAPPNTSSLNQNECDSIMKSIAQFHAVSVKYFELFGSDEFDGLTPPLDDTGFTLRGLFEKISKYVLPSLSTGQRDKWAHFERNFKSLMTDVYGESPKIGGFNVMLHGDLHSFNLLLRDNECKFVDFQLCRRGSPILDMTYFFVTSVKREIFEHHRERLFTLYLRVLNEVLEELGCPRKYSLDELNADFERYKLYCVFVMSVIIPFLWSKTVTLEELNDTEANKMDDVLQSAGYISLFQDWMEVV